MSKIKNKFIVLSGPTAVGKTSISIKLAKKINTQIISADSMQIYKGMDIGTAKITEIEKQGIKHHLIDIINPDQCYSVEDYRDNALSIIEQLNKENIIPIIVGGTGFYIESLIYDLNYSVAPPNEVLREYYENYARIYGNVKLHQILLEKDEETANKIHPNQIRRIIRALEVIEFTGKKFSEINNYNYKIKDDIEFKHFFLNMNRSDLYSRINQRVDIMIKSGLIEETKKLLEQGYTRDLKSLSSIGYKEVIQYFDGVFNLQEMAEKIKQNTRKYAKRQITWFNRDKNKIMIDAADNADDIIIDLLGDMYAK